jgi:dihydrofolate reductase
MEESMRRVILSMSMSLDGYVASDRQHPGALPEDDELMRWRLDWMSGATGGHLMGRTTYQEMATFWPKSEHPYAAPMKDIPKVVFSKTLSDSEATWPTTRVARGDLATEIAAIKKEPGPDVIAWGGATFAAALVAGDLVDEYRLAVQPVSVGDGQSLFGRLPAARYLSLVEARSFACGVVVHIYRPKHGPAAEWSPAGGTAQEG